MENPLSKEQIEELNEIARLPANEQQVKLQEFLRTLKPEQVEFLRKQQSGGCLFCLMSEGKVPTHKVYEDDVVMAVLDINPANKGHTLVFPKKHYENISMMKDVEYLFKIASEIAMNLKEIVGADGCNIFLADGVVAGQVTKHVMVHVIPRFKDDSVNFSWDLKKISEDEMKGIVSKMRGKVVKEDKHEEVEKLATQLYSSDDERVP